ncbi:MAG: hypothetical protein WCF03_16985 [Nitrososphaeraceae archaeon]
MKKSIIVYALFALMVSTAVTYFIVASFGEKLEVVSHVAKAASAEIGLQGSLEGTPQHESTENSHSMLSGITQGSNNQSASMVIQGNKKTVVLNNQTLFGSQKEAAEKSNGHLESGVTTGESTSESIKRSLELPLFLTAGISYVLIGLWMLIDKKSSKVPYIISMVGSIFLIGLYIASHTVDLPLIGLEHVGFLDLLTTALQGGIVAVSAYVMILSSSKTIITTTHTS